MFKAIIVDDENNIRQGLRTIIDWKEWGFLIVGQASDGIEALELYKAIKPSLVITDIKMPRMDGITLSKELKAINPDVEIILLSGYNDFSYAKQAIKYGVRNYLLKPVDTDELCTELSSVYKSVNERLLKNKIECEKSSNLKNYYFSKIVKGELFKSDILNAVNEYGLKTDCSYYLTAMVEIVNYDDLVLNLSEDDLQLIKFAVKNVLEELIEDTGYGLLFEVSERDYVIILTDNADLSNKESAAKTICEYTDFLRDNFSVEITKVFGQTVNSVFELNTSYNSALKSLERNITSSQNHIKSANSNKFSMDMILKYIQLHYMEDINLKKLSEIFYVNSIYLGQIFKKETGRYFHEYINRIRLEHAKKIIEGGGLNINEVAQRVGYKYLDHFYRNFKNEFGCNPGDYKRSEL